MQAERLELSHLAALDPKSSVSTNSTTPALIRAANIHLLINRLQEFSIFFAAISNHLKVAKAPLIP